MAHPGDENWAKPLAELRALSDEELVEQHDELVGGTHKSVAVGVNYYLEELARRRAEAQAKTMIHLTWAIVGLTVANAVLVGVTLLN